MAFPGESLPTPWGVPLLYVGGHVTEEQKLARKQYQREWYLKNREKVLARTNNYYHSNKEKYLELDRERYKRDRSKRIQKSLNRQVENRKWAWELKATLSCNQCGEAHSAALDFHHRDPSGKEYNVSQMFSGTYSRQTILAEIEKCDVLCSNCHRKLHHDLKTNQETTVG